MSWIDSVIPAVAGLLLVIWPRFVFLGSRLPPDASKTRLVRRLGWLLLVIAGLFFLLG